jgi:hypothetical protein
VIQGCSGNIYSYSILVCGVCREPIKEVRDALAVMPRCSGVGPDEPCEVRHVHKGPCQDHAELEAGDGYGEEELGLHLASLLLNSRVGLKDLRRYCGCPLTNIPIRAFSEPKPKQRRKHTKGGSQ